MKNGYTAFGTELMTSRDAQETDNSKNSRPLCELVISPPRFKPALLPNAERDSWKQPALTLIPEMFGFVTVQCNYSKEFRIYA
jgi:hypothetical protein